MTVLPVASGVSNVLGTYHPTSLGIPVARAVAPRPGRRAAPWSLPERMSDDTPGATTTYVPEVGVWTAVLDLVGSGLDQARDLGDLVDAGVALQLLDRSDLREINHDLSGRGQVRAALGRVLLRRLLTDRVDHSVAPNAWRFTRTGSGRLALRGPSVRSGLAVLQGPDVVVAAVGSHPVGVDVDAEPAADIVTDLLGFSAQLVTPDERRRLAGLPPTLVREDLTRLWTLKRAAAAALGVDVLPDLGLIRVRLSPPSVRVDLGLRRAPLACAQWPVTIGGERHWVAVVSAEPA